MSAKLSRRTLTKNFQNALPSAFQNSLPNFRSVADIIAKFPADFCNFTPPIFAISPPSPADFCNFAKAFGKRREVPSPQPMGLDTIFDLASVTKVAATAPAICLLWQQGKLDIHAPVKRFLPEFSGGHKGKVTLLHLLTHTSGLPAFKNYLRMGLKGQKEAIIADICRTHLKAQPGKVFIYSDLGFILLGEIVERVSGLDLDRFCRRHIYEPLKMDWTRFNPPKSWHSKCAATEWRDGKITQGVVHDPNALALGGVAGHAGLFQRLTTLLGSAR